MRNRSISHPGSVVQAVRHLKPGEYVWAPEVAPQGPMLLIVNVSTQRAVLFRNGVPIAATTVSTGRAGSCHADWRIHHSAKAGRASLVYLRQRTHAFHAAADLAGCGAARRQSAGYPASHGCVRLPAAFAKLLYKATRVGMTVVITNEQTTPRVAPTPTIIAQSAAAGELTSSFSWDPARAPEGPVSVLVSAADRRAIVIRNGTVIGSAPVTVEGPVTGTWAYALRNIDEAGQHWVRIELSAASGQPTEIPKNEWSRFHAADDFRRAVASIIQPGTTIIITSDSLADTSATPLTVLDATSK